MWEIAEECNILIGSCHDILTTKLEIHCVVSKFVPRLLTHNQGDSRVAICQELLDLASEYENFLKRIITSNETWVYGYDVEKKMQSSQWVGKNLLRLKKPWQVRSNVKVMLAVFFDIKGVVHHEFLCQGQRVNHWYYLEMLKCPPKRKRQERKTSFVGKQSWFVHHDIAPAHTSLLIRDFLSNTNTTVLPQPPCSFDLAPADFFLISQIEIHFETTTISDDSRDYAKFADRPMCDPDNCILGLFPEVAAGWERCISAGGEYYEGDKAHSVAGMSETLKNIVLKLFEQTK
jgi:hypothetical protein